MPTDFHIFEPAYAFVDQRLSAVLGERLASVTAEVAGPLRAALVLYIVLYGFAILRGAIAEPIMDFSLRAMKLVFIHAIATTPAYGDFVTEPLFTELPAALAQAVSGGSAASIGEAFDELMTYGGYLGDQIARKGNLTDVAPWIVAVVVFVAGAVASAIGFGVVLLAKIALALLVAIGPIFVALALFESTRRYFFGWLSQGVNYLVLFALILAIVQIVLDLMRSQWGVIEGLDPVAGGHVFIALCILAGFFFLHTPMLAAGIAGGASAGIATFGNAARTAGGTAASYDSRPNPSSSPQASGGRS